MHVTPFKLAERFIGMKEVPGKEDNPAILAMLRLDDEWPENDEVPWCSAFVNYIAWLMRLPRSKSLRARSWLGVGRAIPSPFDASYNDHVIVILKRGKGTQPGPDNHTAPGHVGFYAGHDERTGDIFVLGGNQSNSVSVQRYPVTRVLGYRELI